MSKGSVQRPTNMKLYSNNYDQVFKKKLAGKKNKDNLNQNQGNRNGRN